MPKSSVMRRCGAAFTGVGVAAALTVLTPVGAHAAVHGLYGNFGEAFADYTGPTSGGTCALTAGDDNVDSPVATFDDGTKTRSLDLDATFTSSDSSADSVRVKGHVDSSLTLKKDHKDLSAFALRVGGKVAITHTSLSSNCRAGGEVLGAMQVAFTEHKKGWFYLSHTTKKPNSVVEAIVVNLDTNKVVTFDVFQGADSHATSRALLKPGRYEIAETEAGVTAGGASLFPAKSSSLSAKVALTTSITGQFKPLKRR
jgi:hypothetical protein